MKTYHLSVNGMSCGHCVKALTEELRTVQGLTLETVEIGKAVVQFDDSLAADAVRTILTTAVEEAGYTLTDLN
ncbi:MAG: heavy-metal-associated domain-containing protein [Candidatus Kapabacteria bacterium]|jgi:copper chaperone CopZ|nr:heavy-metal-associated domain-containing protein [Candidatus Kapabacteria bacterium]